MEFDKVKTFMRSCCEGVEEDVASDELGVDFIGGGVSGVDLKLNSFDDGLLGETLIGV